MSDPVSRNYIIPDGCPKDIELMSIWAQATEDYLGELTDAQFRAAVNWFKSYIESKTVPNKDQS